MQRAGLAHNMAGSSWGLALSVMGTVGVFQQRSAAQHRAVRVKASEAQCLVQQGGAAQLSTAQHTPALRSAV